MPLFRGRPDKRFTIAIRSPHGMPTAATAGAVAVPEAQWQGQHAEVQPLAASEPLRLKGEKGRLVGGNKGLG
jgi:hypothetical protein